MVGCDGPFPKLTMPVNQIPNGLSGFCKPTSTSIPTPLPKRVYHAHLSGNIQVAKPTEPVGHWVGRVKRNLSKWHLYLFSVSVDWGRTHYFECRKLELQCPRESDISPAPVLMKFTQVSEGFNEIYTVVGRVRW